MVYIFFHGPKIFQHSTVKTSTRHFNLDAPNLRGGHLDLLLSVRLKILFCDKGEKVGASVSYGHIS